MVYSWKEKMIGAKLNKNESNERSLQEFGNYYLLLVLLDYITPFRIILVFFSRSSTSKSSLSPRCPKSRKRVPGNLDIGPGGESFF